MIIVAGGKGTRMGTVLPKQFLLLGAYPILMHTIRRFFRVLPNCHFVVVLPQDQVENWHDLCQQYKFNVDVDIVEGGDTRFDSVTNALSRVPYGAIVGVHDGVRPFFSVRLINEAFESAAKFGSAIPVVPMIDSLRQISNDGLSRSVSRSEFVAVQTPQVFLSSLLKDAYEMAKMANPDTMNSFTDDASVYEYAGHPIKMVNGDRENIKITTQYDLLVAESLISQLRY